MKKCSNCNLSFNLEMFRDKKNQCKPCERLIQRTNRRLKKQGTGNRFDPSYKLSKLQKEGIRFLYKKYTQEQIAKMFHTGQSYVSKILRGLE